jgi:hypothetical protein
MDLVISSEDFRRLTPATQKELLAVLMGGDSDGDAMFGMDDYDAVPASSTQGGTANTGKRVFAINPAQASELLSNLAEKSQQTLRLFAESERVSVDDLVGEGRPYKDMNDLKRSFVGAVNRRLRTVVGNRSAVLFSSDRDRQKIRVMPAAASALRQAMGIIEPEMNEAIEGTENEYEFETECIPESKES